MKGAFDRRHAARSIATPEEDSQVWVRDQEKSGTVVSTEGRSVTVNTDSGQIRRNQRDLVRLSGTGGEGGGVERHEEVPRTSGRRRQPPQRYGWE